jgi:LDH2 family malate/lactate/ureidoglycolate dehydrogenase
LFPQPQVEVSDGRQALMDDVVGTAPVLVATPRAARRLSDIATRLGAETVTLDGHRAGHRITAPAELEGWLTDRGGDIAIVRPDRYVHAIADHLEEAADALRELCRLAGAVT